jgi:hypothetical protein
VLFVVVQAAQYFVAGAEQSYARPAADDSTVSVKATDNVRMCICVAPIFADRNIADSAARLRDRELSTAEQRWNDVPL